MTQEENPPPSKTAPGIVERQQSPARGELCPQRQRCPSLPSPGHSCVWCLFWTLPNHGTCHTHPESSDLPCRPRAPRCQTRPATPQKESHSPKTSKRGDRTPSLPHPRPATCGHNRRRDGGAKTDLVPGGGLSEEVAPSTHSNERTPLQQIHGAKWEACGRGPALALGGNRFENMCCLAQSAQLQRQSQSFQGSRTTARVGMVPGSAGPPGRPPAWPCRPPPREDARRWWVLSWGRSFPLPLQGTHPDAGTHVPLPSLQPPGHVAANTQELRSWSPTLGSKFRTPLVPGVQAGELCRCTCPRPSPGPPGHHLPPDPVHALAPLLKHAPASWVTRHLINVIFNLELLQTVD